MLYFRCVDRREWVIPLFSLVREVKIVEEKIKSLIQPTVEENGYILDEVIFEKEGSTNFLRVIIDKPGYVNVDDCVKVCNLINPILDKEDPIEENYMLDVCSKEKGSDTYE